MKIRGEEKSKPQLCPEVAKTNLRIWFKTIQMVPIPALSLILTGFSVIDVEVTMSDEQQTQKNLQLCLALWSWASNHLPGSLQHTCPSTSPLGCSFPASCFLQIAPRWQWPGGMPPALTLVLPVLSAISPGISEGMAGDILKTCTKSRQSAISLASPAWLGREGCPARLHTQFTCGQIYKYMGQDKHLGAALTALLAL